jgi:hypothetical protein
LAWKYTIWQPWCILQKGIQGREPVSTISSMQDNNNKTFFCVRNEKKKQKRKFLSVLWVLSITCVTIFYGLYYVCHWKRQMLYFRQSPVLNS